MFPINNHRNLRKQRKKGWDAIRFLFSQEKNGSDDLFGYLIYSIMWTTAFLLYEMIFLLHKFVVEYSIIDRRKQEQMDHFVYVPGQWSFFLLIQFTLSMTNNIRSVSSVSSVPTKSEEIKCFLWFSALPRHLPGSSIVEYRHVRHHLICT